MGFDVGLQACGPGPLGEEAVPGGARAQPRPEESQAPRRGRPRVAETGAASMKDMGKVMAWLKPKVQGRADMGALSGKVKAKLAG